jgi:hypothetical protein
MAEQRKRLGIQEATDMILNGIGFGAATDLGRQIGVQHRSIDE